MIVKTLCQYFAIINNTSLLKLFHKAVQKKNLILELAGYTSQYGKKERQVITLPLRGKSPKKATYKIPGYAKLVFLADDSNRVSVDVQPASSQKRDLESLLNLFNILD